MSVINKIYHAKRMILKGKTEHPSHLVLEEKDLEIWNKCIGHECFKRTKKNREEINIFLLIRDSVSQFELL